MDAHTHTLLPRVHMCLHKDANALEVSYDLLLFKVDFKT